MVGTEEIVLTLDSRSWERKLVQLEVEAVIGTIQPECRQVTAAKD